MKNIRKIKEELKHHSIVEDCRQERQKLKKNLEKADKLLLEFQTMRKY